MKKYLLIDSRIREAEYEYLQKYFNVIKLPLSEDVYDEISGHADIFYCKINNKIFVAPNAPIKAKEISKIANGLEEVVEGTIKVKSKYPKDIYYNACQIGVNIVGSRYTLAEIKPTIIVKQGYTKCSIMITGSNSCITTDQGIYTRLVEKEIDAIYIMENNIHLIDRSGNETEKKGFIGGASFTFENKVIIFGDINRLESKKEIVEQLKKYKLELVDFKGLDVLDYGGAIVI